MASIENLLRKFDRAHRQVPIAIASLIVLGALLITVSVLAWRADGESVRLQELQNHTLEVLITADLIEIQMLSILRAERGFLLTSRPAELVPHRRASREVVAAARLLGTLTQDNPVQRPRIARLKAELADYLRITNQTMALRAAGNSRAAMEILRSDAGRVAMARITETITAIKETERRLLNLRASNAERSAQGRLIVLYTVSLAGVFVLIFASLAVVALRQAFAREAAYRRELRRLADTDELTGLANRRELMAGLDRAIAGSRRSGIPLSYIDHFKRVNDGFGHPAGDEVIRKIARAAMAAVRGCDMVGRFGGEEFGVILPGAGVAAAYSICERLRDRIQQEEIDLPDGQIVSVTISSGVARLNDDDTAMTLVERADQALYRAKSDGRDLVRLAA